MAVINSAEITENIVQGVNRVVVDTLNFIQMHPIAGTLMVLLGALLGKIATDWK